MLSHDWLHCMSGLKQWVVGPDHSTERDILGMTSGRQPKKCCKATQHQSAGEIAEHKRISCAVLQASMRLSLENREV